MNFNFKTVEKTVIDGRPYLRQVAEIPPGKAQSFFWSAWRKSKEEIKRHFQLSRDGDKWYLSRLYPVYQGDPHATFSRPYMLKHSDKILPYQFPAVRHLTSRILENVTACDGSDTGIGKSYVALAVCRELGVRPGIICKKAGIAGWKRACRYMDTPPAFIVNWEKMKTGKTVYVRRETFIVEYPVYRDGIRTMKQRKKYRFTWTVPEKTLIIFDESHVANHLNSINNVLYLSARNIPSLSLSATFADRAVNMYSLLSMLNILNYQEFKNFLDERGAFKDAYNQTTLLSEKEIMADINAMIYPRAGYRIGYDNSDVKAFFPSAVFQTEIITIDSKKVIELNRLYAEIKFKIQELKDKGKNAAAMVSELRYRQAAELAKAPVLCELAREYMYEGKHVCIFVNYRETLAYIAKELNTKSLIFGDQDKFKIPRENVIHDFLHNHTNIVISMIQAGGQSIDLHDITGGAQRLSLVCPTNNSIEFKQVLGRTYRAGSKTPPIIKLVYTAGTIEEKVSERVREKLNNINALNDSDFTFFE